MPCTLGYWFVVRDGRLDMHATMRSQDLWLGFCYDVFAATVLHELLAGWIGAELGSYHHHVGSLHLYAEHVARASDDLPATVAPGPMMPSLATDWEDLGPLLREVIGGRPCGHPGWAEISEVMRSYRVRKAGDRDDARTIAHQTNGPLATALTRWYDNLDRAAATLDCGTETPVPVNRPLERPAARPAGGPA